MSWIAKYYWLDALGISQTFLKLPDIEQVNALSRMRSLPKLSTGRDRHETGTSILNKAIEQLECCLILELETKELKKWVTRNPVFFAKQEIKMSDGSGKWLCYNLDNTLYECSNQKKVDSKGNELTLEKPNTRLFKGWSYANRILWKWTKEMMQEENISYVRLNLTQEEYHILATVAMATNQTIDQYVSEIISQRVTAFRDIAASIQDDFISQ